jgi:hypothetical protein
MIDFRLGGCLFGYRFTRAQDEGEIMTRRETEAQTKAAVDKLSAELGASLGGRIGGPVARPVVRPVVRPVAPPFEYRSQGNGELLQLIFVGIPLGILSVYITIKIISFFL